MDLVFQAMSGLMSITGEPEGKPVRAGAPIVDTSSGIMAALAVVSALLKRETTGCGDQVNLAMLDIAIRFIMRHRFWVSIPGKYLSRAVIHPNSCGIWYPGVLLINL
ncbi:MAG: CoA transferase [Bacillota bacterium]